MDIFIVSDLVLLLLVMTAVVLDFRCYKISNRLILVGYILAFVLRFAQGGVQQILYVLWNISIPVIFLYLFYLMRVIGAGDVKLFSMIGGFVSFKEIGLCMLFSFVIGAVFSLAKMVHTGIFYQGLMDGGSYFWGLMSGERKPYTVKAMTENHVIHFSLAILLGMLAMMVYGKINCI